MNPDFILGTAQFGLDYGINNNYGQVSLEEVNKILTLANKFGINILDTAFSYGDAMDRIGNFHKSSNFCFKINTKFILDSDISVSNQLKNSIERLGVSKIDTYFFHSYSDFINNPNIVNELIEIRNSGHFNKIGVSIYENDEMERCIYDEHIDVIQLPFNLLDNNNQRGNLILLAKKYKKEVHVRSVFLQGLFFLDVKHLPLKLIPLTPYILELQRIAKLVGINISDLALAYVKNQKGIDSIIIGVDSANQLEKNFFSSNYELDENIKDLINKILVKETELLNPRNWK